MVFPLLVWGAAVGVAAVISYFTYDNWDEIVKYFDGKKIVILGQRASGKTTLLHFLLKGKIPETPGATIGVDNVSVDGKSLKELNLEVKLSNTQKDFSGCNGSYESWITGAAKAHLLVYLFRIDEWILNTDQVEANIQRDINNIMQSDIKKDVTFFLIGTHLDLLNGIEFNNPQEEHQFIQEIINEPFFKGIQNQFSNNERRTFVVMGSLKDQVGLSKVADSIMRNALES